MSLFCDPGNDEEKTLTCGVIVTHRYWTLVGDRYQAKLYTNYLISSSQLPSGRRLLIFFIFAGRKISSERLRDWQETTQLTNHGKGFELGPSCLKPLLLLITPTTWATKNMRLGAHTGILVWWQLICFVNCVMPDKQPGLSEP